MQNKVEIIIYKTCDNETQIKAIFEKETVWLYQKQIADIFVTHRTAITKYLLNIFKT